MRDDLSDDIETELASRFPSVICARLADLREVCDVSFGLCVGRGDACLVARDGACVLSVDDPKSIPAASVLHELLHAERYYLERVPQLVSIRYQGMAEAIENDLEHLWVLPRQRALGHPSDAIHARSNASAWRNFIAHGHSGVKRKRVMMLLWFEAHAIGDESALIHARKMLKDEGQLEWAETLWKEFEERMSDKVEAFAYFLQQAEIDDRDFGYHSLRARPSSS